MMKGLLSLFAALVCSLALAAAATAGSAAEKANAEASRGTASVRNPAQEGAAAPAGKRSARKGRVRQVTGTVQAIDASSGTLTVKGRKGSMSLKAKDGALLEGIGPGDRVVVKYAGDTATRVTKAGAGRKTAPGRETKR